MIAVERRAVVGGDQLIDASVGQDQYGAPAVNFRFDSAGGRRFARATQENVGKPIAIILDGRVISAPVINEPILGGAGIISGNFSTASANELAILLRAEEHTSELQSLMRISYAVFCLKKQTNTSHTSTT